MVCKYGFYEFFIGNVKIFRNLSIEMNTKRLPHPDTIQNVTAKLL